MDIFLSTSFVVEKTSAQKIIESLPKPMQPVVDPTDPNGIGSLLDSNLYKFLHKLCSPFLDKFPQELKEIIDGSTLYTSSGFWLEMYGAGFGLYPRDGEEEATFKSRVINEMFRAKVTNKAIKDALQEFSSTEVFVLDRLATVRTTADSSEYVMSSLPFLSVDQQEIRSKVSSIISAIDTSITVDSTVKFPLSGYLKVDNEIMYFSKSSSISFSVTRAQKGTEAAQHLTDSYICFYNDIYSMFLDYFNVMNDVELNSDGETIISGAFEFDVWITPYPDNENTRLEILSVIEKFKAAGTKAYFHLGLPYGA